MAEHRTRKNKETPHYNFLYSWQPNSSQSAHVKGESNSEIKPAKHKVGDLKRAEEWAKDESSIRIKKDIIRSLILVSFILCLEVVIYLAWKRISVL